MPDKIEARLDDARLHLTVEIFSEQTPLASVRLEPVDVAALIELLASLRAQMTDAVPIELDPGTMTDALLDPPWVVQNHAARRSKLLGLRHPGLGWLSFLIRDEDAARMAALLARPSSPAE